MQARTEEEDVVLGQLLQVIIDDIWWLIGIAATIVAIAGFYCYVAKPVYSADAHVRVETSDNTSQALTQTQTGATISTGQSTIPTDAEIEMIKSRGVVAPVCVCVSACDVLSDASTRTCASAEYTGFAT